MSTITPNSIQQSQQRFLTINQRINEAATTIVSEYTAILTLAPVADKDRETTAAETYQIECHATAIVRTIEDLLMVSRSLKESWILGQVASFQTNYER
ncbi:surfeit locus protein 5 subunit 22 of mediator complex-domain-containing protein [Lipomyces kononenkoae]